MTLSIPEGFGLASVFFELVSEVIFPSLSIHCGDFITKEPNLCTNGVPSNISSLHHFLACLCLSLPIQGFFYFIQPTKCGFRLQNYFPWIPLKS